MWLLYQSYHTATGLTTWSLPSTLLLCYVGSCRLAKTIFEFDTRILLSNITVTYEACDVCISFVPSYLLIYLSFLDIASPVFEPGTFRLDTWSVPYPRLPNTYISIIMNLGADRISGPVRSGIRPIFRRSGPVF